MGGRGAVRHRAQCRQQQPNGCAVDDIVLESILIYTLRGAFTTLMFCCLDDDDLFKSPFCSCFCYLKRKIICVKKKFCLIELNAFCCQGFGYMVDFDLYKVCDYAGYHTVMDNDVSVHCSFSESGPIVGNCHRALVSRLSSGRRCFLVFFPTVA